MFSTRLHVHYHSRNVWNGRPVVTWRQASITRKVFIACSGWTKLHKLHSMVHSSMMWRYAWSWSIQRIRSGRVSSMGWCTIRGRRQLGRTRIPIRQLCRYHRTGWLACSRDPTSMWNMCMRVSIRNRYCEHLLAQPKHPQSWPEDIVTIYYHRYIDDSNAMLNAIRIGRVEWFFVEQLIWKLKTTMLSYQSQVNVYAETPN